MAYEAVLLFAVAFFATWLFFFASGARDATAGSLRHVLQLFIAVVFASYFLWCWLRGGQTLAMKAWGIRLVDRQFLEFKNDLASKEGQLLADKWGVFLYQQDKSGHHFGLRPGTAFARLLLASVFVPTGVSFLWALFDRDQQFLHDRLAGTRLVDA